ncbi:unnamed protein product, partial [Linum tenue]
GVKEIELVGIQSLSSALEFQSVSSSIVTGLISDDGEPASEIVKGVSNGDGNEDLNSEGGGDSFTRGRLIRNQRLESPIENDESTGAG